ncbi:MAG: Gfo/Idh/MocA family oxidoreductase [Planctomycetes bacterium]|nr:Gfo/Idh/MocA family oxidoreductase [Planctomycetota bacterium]
MASTGAGIVGLGIWGETHLMAYAEHPHVDLVKVCDLNKSRARKMAKEYGAKSWCTDYRELVTDPEIDIVSIVTPDFAHTDIAVAAAKNKKHILVEKPLATTVADCKKIISAAKRNKVKLMCDFHNHWNPCMHRVKEAVDAGEMGTLQFMSLRLNDTIEVPRDWLAWSGKSSVLWFLASHSVDLVRWIFKDEVDRVYTVARSRVLKKLGKNTPDFYMSTLEMKKGAVVAIENGWIMSDKMPIVCAFQMELIGDKGTILSDVVSHEAVQKFTDKEVSLPDLFGRPEIQGKTYGFAVESIRHFIDCVRLNRKPHVTGEDGLAATKVILAMMESAKTGKPVKVR